MSNRHYIRFNPSGPAQYLPVPPLPRDILYITILFELIIASVVFVLELGEMKMLGIKKLEDLENGPQRFSYKELYEATKGFKENELFGRGYGRYQGKNKKERRKKKQNYVSQIYS